MLRSLVRPALLLVGIAALASPAFAVNLVTNPGFAGNLNGWSAGGSTIYDAANDATGGSGSGSAQNTFVASGISSSLALSQCIAAGPGSYTLGGKVLIPNGQAGGGSGIVTVSFFSAPGCSTGLLTFDSISTTTTGSSQTLSKPVTAPAGTVAIWVTGQNGATSAGTHIVNFDDFVVDNAAAAPIPALDPRALVVLVAAIAAIGALALRR